MDLQAKKLALQMISTGLYVLTAREGNDAVASTISWLSQASFEPPLVMTAIKKKSHTYEVARKTNHFAINILERSQIAMAQNFFKSVKLEERRLGGYRFEESDAGDPIFVDSPAWIECKVLEWVEYGDHSVVVAEVANAGVRQANIAPMALRDTPWEYGG